MQVDGILGSKGREVRTIQPDATIGEAIGRLCAERVGRASVALRRLCRQVPARSRTARLLELSSTRRPLRSCKPGKNSDRFFLETA